MKQSILKTRILSLALVTPLVPFSCRQGAQETFCQAKPEDERKKPNIIFILADDMGWGDLQVYGHLYIKTPNPDTLDGTLPDLGEVKDLARVVVNGKDAGILWKIPFSPDITEFLVPGKNEIEIKITNMWANRLIGDQVNPREKRYTEPMNTMHYDEPHEQILLPSGLLGPVKISVSVVQELSL